MKVMIRPALILLAVTSIAAALLGVVESVTREPIRLAEIKTQNEAMQASLPSAASFEEISEAIEGTTISRVNVGKDASGEVIGYVVATNPSGFGGAVPTTVGLDLDGVIMGVSVTTPSETPGLGVLAAEPKFTSQFAGLSGSAKLIQDGGTVQSITSATITARAVADGVDEALQWFANGGAN